MEKGIEKKLKSISIGNKIFLVIKLICTKYNYIFDSNDLWIRHANYKMCKMYIYNICKYKGSKNEININVNDKNNDKVLNVRYFKEWFRKK